MDGPLDQDHPGVSLGLTRYTVYGPKHRVQILENKGEKNMYGTVAKLKVKPGGIDKLNEWSPEERDRDSGARAIYAFQMDDDPNEVYTIAVFDSKEAYMANAESPEQDKRYREMLQWLEGEPEWHDGEIVYHEQY
jgi:quinol monooxygenase YgiN